MPTSPRRSLWSAILIGVGIGLVTVIVLRLAGVSANAAPVVGGITGAVVVIVWPMLRRR